MKQPKYSQPRTDYTPIAPKWDQKVQKDGEAMRDYTMSTAVKPTLKFNAVSPKQNTYLGKIS